MDKQKILALCNHILGETGKIVILASETNVVHIRDIQVAARQIAAEVQKPDEPKEDKPDKPKRKQEAGD